MMLYSMYVLNVTTEPCLGNMEHHTWGPREGAGVAIIRIPTMYVLHVAVHAL